jgi:hypothetical protein
MTEQIHCLNILKWNYGSFKSISGSISPVYITTYNREILQQLVQLAVNILKEKLMKCVFNVALTDSHLQRMVYQEIQDTDSQIRGVIVPKDIATAPALYLF